MKFPLFWRSKKVHEPIGKKVALNVFITTTRSGERANTLPMFRIMEGDIVQLGDKDQVAEDAGEIAPIVVELTRLDEFGGSLDILLRLDEFNWR